MRIFCVKRKSAQISIAMFLIFTVLALFLALSIDGTSSAAVWFGNSTRKVPIYSVDTDKKQIAISFDAAWGADKTEGILEILSEFGCSATFFLTGIWVDAFPDEVLAIDEAGMEIGTHSSTHPDMVKLDSATMKSELETCMSKITAITGKEISLFRPPYGSYNNQLIETAESLGLTTIQWSIDSLDWKGLSASDICSRVMSRAASGAIILMHNNADNVLDALRLVLNRLKVAGYEITSIGELIYWQNYTIDRNGVQHQS